MHFARLLSLALLTAEAESYPIRAEATPCIKAATLDSKGAFVPRPAMEHVSSLGLMVELEQKSNQN